MDVNNAKIHQEAPKPRPTSTGPPSTRPIQSPPASTDIKNLQPHRSQLSHHIQPHPSHDSQPPHKYPKIQARPSQVQIKMKKPIPIAVLPKPLNKSETKFNPNIKTSTTIKLKHEIGMSKKWVLPPRPRPGRKPVNTDEDEETKRQQLKEIHKGVKEMNMTEYQDRDKDMKETKDIRDHKEPIKVKDSVIEGFKEGSAKLASVKEAPAASVKENLFKDGKDSRIPENIAVTPLSMSTITSKVKEKEPRQETNNETPELMNLKMEYLSKLKEQDLINNYIGVINNQIKQLDFIKNGYMTLDTLNQLNTKNELDSSLNEMNASEMNASEMTGNTTSTMTLNENMNTNTTTDTNTNTNMNLNDNDINIPQLKDLEGNITRRFNDLETINNSNDLEKFLNYFNKSSNLIYRVTKNYNQNGNINDQIVKYLQLRTTFKTNEKKVKKVKKVKQDVDAPKSSLTNDYLNLSNDKACPICAKTSPCFCLDIDRKFNENNWNESYK